jgi:hypothetical protein
MKIVDEVNPGLRLVNSEHFQWLRCMSGHRKCDMKPDLFSAHHALIQFSAPYDNAPTCVVNRLFGKFIGWENRASIHCIWDAKWKINMDAFGEQCKYLQIAGEDCVDHNGVALKLKGVLFDKDEFWMIKSSGSTITEVLKCKWSQSGSKQLLVGFLEGFNPWLEATNALCNALGVTIVDYTETKQNLTAWLGTGANGRVFRLSNGQVIKIIVGLKGNDPEKEYLFMLKLQKQEDVAHLVFPIIEDSFRSGETRGVRFAGYLLAQVGEQLVNPLSPDVKSALARSLCELHSHDVIHGDPRIENVLILNGAIKWIDFRLSEMVTSKIDKRKDVEILLISLGGNVATASEDIQAYLNDSCVDNLHRVLTQL